MYVAKMHTRYPEFHGTGYYNFLMARDEDTLEGLIEQQSHDFSYEGTKFIALEGEDLMSTYPTKQDLNKELFA